MFVSEGNTTEKFRAINRSNYLSAVYNTEIKTIKGSLVIYGWSASEQEDHIFQAIDQKGITDIAISIHSQNPDWEVSRDKIENKISNSKNLGSVKRYYFKSDSVGCWIY